MRELANAMIIVTYVKYIIQKFVLKLVIAVKMAKEAL